MALHDLPALADHVRAATGAPRIATLSWSAVGRGCGPVWCAACPLVQHICAHQRQLRVWARLPLLLLPPLPLLPSLLTLPPRHLHPNTPTAQGGTMTFMYGSEAPAAAAERFCAHVALAPVVFPQRLRTPLFAGLSGSGADKVRAVLCCACLHLCVRVCVLCAVPCRG